MTSLHGKTLFITGASRGIGLAIALRAARDGANIAIAAKTDRPHPKLPGTIYTAAEEIREAGGEALPLICDIRHEDEVSEAVAKTAAEFGGIDICVNNASAIFLAGTLQTPMKRFDLMHNVNARGAFMVSKTCLPILAKAENPHILTLCPPLDMKAKWFGPNVAYAMAKFGMSMAVLGMAAEFANDGIGINALWPRTIIATAAVQNLPGGNALIRASRKPQIVADAAHIILTSPAAEFTGNFCIDDTLLAANGVTDFDHYRVDPACRLQPDFFVPDESEPPDSLEALE